jgi:23S rRNA (guanine745-N1)-methyltransferase
VPPVMPRPGHGLLRCPLCKLELTAAAGALVCRDRHGFDLARGGYVNFLRGGRRPAAGGDSPVQLQHRAAFLDAGHFDVIAATIAGLLRQDSARPAFGQWRILDAGCGTGHHLAKIAATLRPSVIGLGFDIAKDAARKAARRWPVLAFAVVDVWTEWPVEDATVDLVISVFAPKNFAEAARVLRPGGWLAVAYPGPDHMIELSNRFGLMRQHEHKAQRYREAARRFIGPASMAQIRGHAALDDAGIRSAILMGPNARHIAHSVPGAEPGLLEVTFDINVLFARKSGRQP